MGRSDGQKARRGINWRRVFTYQTHGALVVLLAAAITTGVAHFTAEPDTRPLRLYDAAVSLPAKPDTVPMVWACVGPFCAILITAAVVEFAIMRDRQSTTMALQAFCHIVFMAIVGFAVVLAVTEATKPVASRFRPDFLARCNPAVKLNAPLNFEGEGVTSIKCQPKSLDVLNDGRKSFPSGHSSNTLSLCWFCVLYLFHALYYREGSVYMGGLWAKSSCLARAAKEILQGLLIVWGCFILCMAWFIGVSRYTDHKHNIDDVLGGFIVALLWMTPIVLITLGQLTFYQQRLREDEQQDEETEFGTLPLSAKDATGVAAATAGHHQQQQQHGLVAPGPAAPMTAAADAAAGPPVALDDKEKWYDAAGSVSMINRSGDDQA